MNNRQKKRIKDAARLVNSVTEMLDDMNDMSKQYDADLKSFIAKLNKKEQNNESSNSVHDPTSSESFNLITLADIDKIEEEAEADHPGNGKKAPPKKRGRPPKNAIKNLYRQVMRKCHPDRSSHEKLTHRQAIQYSWAVDEVTKAYSKNDLKSMVFIAAMVDEYSKILTPKDCLSHINDLYTDKSGELNKVQKSVAWLWGINWDTLEARYQIVEAVAFSYGVKLPSKVEVLDLLVKHEIEN